MIYPITDFAAVQRLLSLCTCLLVVLSGAAAAADGPRVDVGDTAPPWELLDGLADGEQENRLDIFEEAIFERGGDRHDGKNEDVL